MNKNISKNKKQNSGTNNKDKPKQHQQDGRLQGSQHTDRGERLTQEMWQKQHDLEQLKVNPEEILEEEEKRTNPICIEK